ncbi:MAG: response regulator [Cyanobacteria bacterium P01_H01_bin.74]
MTTETKQPPVQVLLVENDPAWQNIIGRLVQNHPAFMLCNTVDHYDAAIKAFQSYRPDFVILDWQINGKKSGVDVGHALLELGLPAEKMVVVSSAPLSAMPAHPFFYIPKIAAARDLIDRMVLLYC